MYTYYKFNAVFHDLTIELSKYYMSFSIMTTSELRIYTHTSLVTQRRTFFSAVCFFFLDREGNVLC